MDLTLKRMTPEAEGVFGHLLDDQGRILATTLEHSYSSESGDGSYASKIPNGIYTCIRGQHQLHSMKAPFTTFEITGIKGHKNILFHIGNFNEDSDGCVLLGTGMLMAGDTSAKTKPMLTRSKEAFSRFMSLQKDVNAFTLTVT